MDNKKYKQCVRCIMDESAKDILFDSDGICNFCTDFESRIVFENSKNSLDREQQLLNFVNSVKKKGRNKEYDCIIGVSGGVDSSWVLYQAKLHGLRPLAVHMDNGWNSELAQANIETLVKNLNVDLYTHVIDWDAYRAMMNAFFKADVIDVELLYDNAMLAVNYNLAKKYGISFILSGSNFSTEGMRMPKGWNWWYKYDGANIVSICKEYGVRHFKNFPLINTVSYISSRFVRKIEWVHFLDFVNYNKNDAVSLLQTKFGYKPYPFKHYESVFTRFYQGYILPNKFGIDKRKIHLSTLIISGQLTRNEALKIMENSPYISKEDLYKDIDYFLRKMKWQESDLYDYLSRNQRGHGEFRNELGFYEKVSNLCKKNNTIFYLFRSIIRR